MNTEVKSNTMVEAKWWEPADKGKLLCTLCPRYCMIGEGQPGFCYIRQNHGGKLYTLGYARPTGFAIDPIEKKPLNHLDANSVKTGR
jgi:pyruvate formate lyase activating enzyme